MINKSIIVLALLFYSCFNYAVAQTVSTGFSDFGAASGIPIQIEAEELEILDVEKIAIFKRDVIVIQGDTELQTKKLTVFYKDDEEQNSQTISKFEATGGVLVTSKDQKATGDYGIYEYESNSLKLTGEKVVLTEGGSVAVGNELTVYLDSGRIILLSEEDNRVQILIDNSTSSSADSPSNQ